MKTKKVRKMSDRYAFALESVLKDPKNQKTCQCKNIYLKKYQDIKSVNLTLSTSISW